MIGSRTRRCQNVRCAGVKGGARATGHHYTQIFRMGSRRRRKCSATRPNPRDDDESESSQSEAVPGDRLSAAGYFGCDKAVAGLACEANGFTGGGKGGRRDPASRVDGSLFLSGEGQFGYSEGGRAPGASESDATSATRSRRTIATGSMAWCKVRADGKSAACSVW